MRFRELTAKHFLVIVCVIVAIIILLAGVPAIAQEVITGDPSVDGKIETAVNLFDVVLRIFGIVILFFGSIATSKLPARMKHTTDALILQKESEWRAAMKEAMVSGVKSGIKDGLTGRALVSHALRHTITSTPDAIAGLIPSTQDLIKQAPEIVMQQLPAPIRGVLERIIEGYTVSVPPTVIGTDDLAEKLRHAVR